MMFLLGCIFGSGITMLGLGLSYGISRFIKFTKLKESQSFGDALEEIVKGEIEETALTIGKLTDVFLNTKCPNNGKTNHDDRS